MTENACPTGWEGNEAAVDFDDLRKLTQIVGGETLPDNFVRLYLMHNGGCPVDDRDELRMLHGFNSVRYGKLPIEQLYQDMVEWWPHLKNLLPFAYDPGGHPFMLSLQPDTLFKVYVHLQDLEDGGDRLVQVADNFDSFLEQFLMAPYRWRFHET
jgi:hypothetical protein